MKHHKPFLVWLGFKLMRLGARMAYRSKRCTRTKFTIEWS